MPKYKYYMHDARGDDYTMVVTADDEKSARSIATQIDDDANPRGQGKLIDEDNSDIQHKSLIKDKK